MAAWEATHQRDTSHAGNAYLPKVPGPRQPLSDEYTEVSFSGANQVVTGVVLNLQPTSATVAKDTVHQQFPADAVVLSDKVASGSLANPQCELILYQSATLGKLYADPAIGDPQGYVGVVLSTELNPDGSANTDGNYDDQRVDTASLTVAEADYTSGSC